MLRWAVLISLLWATHSAHANDKPNIMLIVADDLNCAIEPYGDQSAITPNLSRLASMGTTFLRCYCQQAVCNPSRSSFLTGLRPNTVGVDDLSDYFRDTAPAGDSVVTLPQHFKRNGFHTVNIGKMFHNMGNTQDPQSWSVKSIYHQGPHSDDTIYAAQFPKGMKRPVKAMVTESDDVPDATYWDGKITDAACAMLQRIDSDQPFFLAVGYWRPHLPFVAPKKYWQQHSAALIPKPHSQSPPLNAPAIALHPSKEIRGYGGVPKTAPFTMQQIAHYRHGYYASVTFLDAQIGRLVNGLKESGHEKNTIIVFTSDHGFHIGQSGLWGKTSNFELDARVPLIIVDPRSSQTGGQRSSSICELVDLFPTIADLADVSGTLPGNLEGMSLVPVLSNPKTVVKEAAFTQHQHPFYGKASNWRGWGDSIRTDRFRFTLWRSIKDGHALGSELYDHQVDPYETVNVAEKTEYMDTTASLEQRVRKQFPR